jgi:hypothetical protein
MAMDCARGATSKGEINLRDESRSFPPHRTQTKGSDEFIRAGRARRPDPTGDERGRQTTARPHGGMSRCPARRSRCPARGGCRWGPSRGGQATCRCPARSGGRRNRLAATARRRAAASTRSRPKNRSLFPRPTLEAFVIDRESPVFRTSKGERLATRRLSRVVEVRIGELRQRSKGSVALGGCATAQLAELLLPKRPRLSAEPHTSNAKRSPDSYRLLTPRISICTR